MPIDPTTGLITQNGTREEVYRAEQDRARQLAYETECSRIRSPTPVSSFGSTAGLDMPASGPLRAFLILVLLAMLAFLIPSSWRWVTGMWHQGRVIELVVGFILVFMACMAVIAVIIAVWQFFARAGIIKLAILAACGWFAWKVFIPHSIPKPNLAPVHATAPAATAHPARHPKH